jgi:hypothetical protein
MVLDTCENIHSEHCIYAEDQHEDDHIVYDAGDQVVYGIHDNFYMP